MIQTKIRDRKFKMSPPFIVYNASARGAVAVTAQLWRAALYVFLSDEVNYRDYVLYDMLCIELLQMRCSGNQPSV